jgi:mannose-6-phosphate isomerase
MRHLPVKQGDFVYLPAGIVHALKKGGIVYEIQQATDITYRFYDYDRRDAQGNARPLHLEQAIRCIDYSLSQADAHPQAKHTQTPDTEITTFINSDSFCVKRYTFHGSDTLPFPRYALMTCVAGEGTADGIPIHKGMNFLVTAGSSVSFQSRMTILCTCEHS